MALINVQAIMSGMGREDFESISVSFPLQLWHTTKQKKTVSDQLLYPVRPINKYKNTQKFRTVSHYQAPQAHTYIHTGNA